MLFSKLVEDALDFGQEPPKYMDGGRIKKDWPDKKCDPLGFLEKVFNLKALNYDEMTELAKQATRAQGIVEKI